MYMYINCSFSRALYALYMYMCWLWTKHRAIKYNICFPPYLPVTLAKGIGNGFPLAAVVTTPGMLVSRDYCTCENHYDMVYTQAVFKFQNWAVI